MRLKQSSHYSKVCYEITFDATNSLSHITQNCGPDVFKVTHSCLRVKTLRIVIRIVGISIGMFVIRATVIEPGLAAADMNSTF